MYYLFTLVVFGFFLILRCGLFVCLLFIALFGFGWFVLFWCAFVSFLCLDIAIWLCWCVWWCIAIDLCWFWFFVVCYCNSVARYIWSFVYAYWFTFYVCLWLYLLDLCCVGLFVWFGWGYNFVCLCCVFCVLVFCGCLWFDVWFDCLDFRV